MALTCKQDGGAKGKSLWMRNEKKMLAKESILTVKFLGGFNKACCLPHLLMFIRRPPIVSNMEVPHRSAGNWVALFDVSAEAGKHMPHWLSPEAEPACHVVCHRKKQNKWGDLVPRIHSFSTLQHDRFLMVSAEQTTHLICSKWL